MGLGASAHDACCRRSIEVDEHVVVRCVTMAGDHVATIEHIDTKSGYSLTRGEPYDGSLEFLSNGSQP